MQNTLNSQQDKIQDAFASTRKSFIRFRLGYATFVSVRRSYMYVETPKNACTTTKAILWSLESLPHRAPWPSTVHTRLQHEGRPSLLDFDYDTAQFFLENKTMFKFCIFRDPVERLISCFKNKLKDTKIENYQKIMEAISNDYNLASVSDIEFSHFAEYVCNQNDEKRDPHWMSQWRLSLASYIKFDFVATVENYMRDMSYVLGRLAAPPQLCDSLSQKINASSRVVVDLSPEIEQLIRETYKHDYDLLEFNKTRD